MIGIVLSNPKHHAEMLLPVAEVLAQAGERVRVLSLAELRGFETPDWKVDGVEVIRVLPRVRMSPSAGSRLAVSGRGAWKRILLQRAVWHGGLGLRLRWLLRGCQSVIMPNDAAYPYRDLAAWLRDRKLPFALMQEGIRFPLPNETASDTYGRGGASAVCAWGEGSAEHFRRIGVSAQTIRITGNPRFDHIAVEDWRARGLELLAAHAIDAAPLLYLSNPIDDQGFCSNADKLQLFSTFLAEAGPVLAARGTPIVVKLHPREDVAAFRAIAERAPCRTIVLDAAPLFAVLAVARAAVVLASTVGLEALAFGVPLAALAIPHHGFVFEYVSSGAAVGLTPGTIASGVSALCEHADERATARAALVERHLARSGPAAPRIAAVLREIAVAS